MKLLATTGVDPLFLRRLIQKDVRRIIAPHETNWNQMFPPVRRVRRCLLILERAKHPTRCAGRARVANSDVELQEVQFGSRSGARGAIDVTFPLERAVQKWYFIQRCCREEQFT